METVTPEKQAEYERQFRDAFGDLEPLIRSMIQGADAVFTIAEGMATAGDDTHRNAVFFVGEQLQECAAKLDRRWRQAHTAMIGGPEIVERQERDGRPDLAQEAGNRPGRDLAELERQWSAAADRYNTDDTADETRETGPGAEVDRLEAVILETPCRSYADAAAKLRVYSKMKFESDNPPSPFAPKGTLDLHDRFAVSALLDLERLAAAQ